MDESKQNFAVKKWHQKWWGIFFLLVFAVFFIYLGAFIYQVVALIEVNTQAVSPVNAQSFNTNSQPLSNQVRIIAESADDPYFGPKDAEIVIVEFGDFQCPYCAEAFPALKQIRQEYQDTVKIIYRDFPNVAAHASALNAAMAAECADDQAKFWEYHDNLFNNQQSLSLDYFKSLAGGLGLDTAQFNQCLDSKKYFNEILNDLEDAVKLGISDTPTFFINGNKLVGAVSYNNFKAIIEKAQQALAVEKQMQTQ